MPRPRKADSSVFNPAEMLRVLADGVRTQASRPNIHAYKPYDKQEQFHRSTKRIRLAAGGNRSGKTQVGCAEDVYYLRGQHPYKKVPPAPVAGRIVAVDIIEGLNQIIIPKLKQYLPPSLLINGSWEDSYNKTDRLLTLSNGSTCDLMTYEQDPEKFVGTSRHFIHFDEEPPQPIYNECWARLTDFRGDTWLTMTPLNGMTWVYDDIYLKGTEENNPLIYVIELDIMDNPYIPYEAKIEFLQSITDPDERAAREHGRFVQLGGQVYKNFSDHHIVEPFIPPKDWALYRSLDHGYNNPTAVYWHAVSPDGHVVTFAEHYKREWTIKQHAEYIKAFEAKLSWPVANVKFGVADPAILQRQATTGMSVQMEYARHGVFWALGNNDVLIGVNQVNEYLKTDEENKPYWVITRNCTNLTREMKRLRWKTWSGKKAAAQNNPYEQIHKKDDHGPDSVRYFFTIMPDLSIKRKEEEKKLPQNTPTASYDTALIESLRGGYKNTTEWKTFAGTDLVALEYD